MCCIFRGLFFSFFVLLGPCGLHLAHDSKYCFMFPVVVSNGLGGVREFRREWVTVMPCFFLQLLKNGQACLMSSIHVYGFPTSWCLTPQNYLKGWCGLEVLSSVAENYKGCQQNMACLEYVCFLFPRYLEMELLGPSSCQDKTVADSGHHISRKSGVEVLIVLKCLNGSTSYCGQAGVWDITCCAACSKLTGSRNR